MTTQPAMMTADGATTPPAVRHLFVPGDVAPKGSMKCIGARGKVKHVVVEDDKAGRGKRWRPILTTACKDLAAALGGPVDGPCLVGALFVVPRPPAAARRLLPHLRSSGVGGDTDKLTRMLLDSMDVADVFTDDARVVGLLPFKVYELPDRPPGVHIYFALPGPGRSARILTEIHRLAPELDQLN